MNLNTMRCTKDNMAPLWKKKRNMLLNFSPALGKHL